MRKKFIAAVVLASLTLWSVPAILASSLQPASSGAQKPVQTPAARKKRRQPRAAVESARRMERKAAAAPI
jgi:hypothetical protein